MKIAGILKKSDMLMVTYIVTYNTDGSVLKLQNSEMISKETLNDKININI